MKSVNTEIKSSLNIRPLTSNLSTEEKLQVIANLIVDQLIQTQKVKHNNQKESTEL